MPLDVAQSVVEPHLEKFSVVLTSAWESYALMRDLARSPMRSASASTRGMLVSDFTGAPASAVFKDVKGVSVDFRYRRPWVNLAGGLLQVRFRKLTPAFALCPNDSDRAVRLAYHLDDPACTLDLEKSEATYLTAGYVLNAAELRIERMALVCHVGTTLLYAIPLPGGTATLPRPEQLPIAPLTEPIIRSARTAAAKRVTKDAQGVGT